MTTWPASPFPQSPLASGYSDTSEQNIIRSAVDAGPAQTRRRHSRALRTISATYRLSAADRTTWAAWWADEISHGALWFDWPDVIGSTTKEARLVDPPVFSPIAGGMYWDMSLVLEVRP